MNSMEISNPTIIAALVAAAISLIGILVGVFTVRKQAEQERKKIWDYLEKDVVLDGIRTRRDLGSSIEGLRVMLWHLWQELSTVDKYNGHFVAGLLEKRTKELDECFNTYERQWESSKPTLQEEVTEIGVTLHHDMRHCVLRCKQQTKKVIVMLRRDRGSDLDSNISSQMNELIDDARAGAQRFLDFLKTAENMERRA